MCYTTKLEQDQKKLAKRFKTNPTAYNNVINQIFNGFNFPKTPVITNQLPQSIEWYHWGLIPEYATDNSIRKFTLNAKIESIGEKPSFKHYIDNRCLIIVDGFYEWQWLDARGKQKLKHLINNDLSEIYTIGGIWSEWNNPESGELIKSYAMITQPANELMSEIHNAKKRMPLILNPGTEQDWLNGVDMQKCIEPVMLSATPIFDKPIQTSLF